ncbi:MAG: leucine-rich repeat domain-containing protein [Candidatus Moeniiplasma glomeromycotorum]|nr:leucine-rich repeat domain-containing protein [Candidatus Moeniiplasma glomeromycotorum]MCE8167259.1 leucine-rich repeat domain-containing protein [Candidatus Moeniiplasma glomeromycotorum]MCE8168728.1 leucine-rich repeat domain-containing protein [Candidatus Moeniiplasma glomeromycotorum]
MVNNQTEFNEKYSKELNKIELRRKRKFTGQLVVENYLELENLSLREIRSIDKLSLKNLPQVKQCTVWDCGVKELIVDNCPKLEKLNVRKNLLTGLEFLANLENLEELEIDGNSKLTEILSSYSGNWKTCRKDIQELIELTNQKPYEFRKLQEENEKLKKEIEVYKNSSTIDNSIDFEKKYQKLKGTLNFLVKEEELKSKEIDALITDDLIESVKEQKESLSNLEKVNQELKEKFSPFEQVYQKIEQKEKELENLKNVYLEKVEKKKEKCKKVLEKLLKKMTQPNDSDFEEVIKESKEYLLKKTSDSSQELEAICSLKETIIKLQNNFDQREKQINQIIINGGYNINHFESTFYDSSSGGTINTNQQGTEELTPQILVSRK